jgi:hypothetical protein
MYAFKSNSNFPPAGQPLQWELIDGLSSRTLAAALRACLGDYLDFEYCVPIIMNARDEVLFCKNIVGSLYMPMGLQKPWWVPGHISNISFEGLLATTRGDVSASNETEGHVSFYNPEPSFDLAIKLGVEWASQNPVWLNPDHDIYLNQDDRWPALSRLPSLLKRLVLDRPEVLARVRRFGAPLANVFDLL